MRSVESRLLTLAPSTQMLLDKSMRLAHLREMMTAEVGLESVGMLELMVRNRRLRGESDDKTLEELAFRDNIQVVISKVRHERGLRRMLLSRQEQGESLLPRSGC